MTDLFNTPAFGIIVSIFAFEIGIYVYGKTRVMLLHPLVVGICLVILFLSIFNIEPKSYENGGNIIKLFIGPATVCLAVPLYKQLDILKKNAMPILVGVFLGSASGVVSVILLGKLFKLNHEILLSLVPKSITNPIGVELSRQLGGNISLTVAVIMVTGLLGPILTPWICKILGIKNKIALGIAIGTASHAVGTSKAIELGEIEGAMSGLAIGLAGLSTVLAAPILILLLM